MLIEVLDSCLSMKFKIVIPGSSLPPDIIEADILFAIFVYKFPLFRSSIALLLLILLHLLCPEKFLIN